MITVFDYYGGSEEKVIIISTDLNDLLSFYVFSVMPNKLCKNRGCWPCEHSILRVNNLRQYIIDILNFTLGALHYTQ